ncbi:MAG: hypothetical protein Q4B26_03205 [Eubacteriales bacterium]|nr:hypothetical protein [Eubacteriales bacterium]
MGKDNYLGRIERGVVKEVTADGYIIASLDRDGITTPPILSAYQNMTFEVGEKVYFFYFNDGTGRILCGL